MRRELTQISKQTARQRIGASVERRIIRCRISRICSEPSEVRRQHGPVDHRGGQGLAAATAGRLPASPEVREESELHQSGPGEKKSKLCPSLFLASVGNVPHQENVAAPHWQSISCIDRRCLVCSEAG